MQEARALAERADTWEAQTSRAEQTIAWVRGGAPLGPEGHVPRPAGVLRVWHKHKKRLEPMVVVTTALQRSASWSVRHEEARPEIAQD
jgi:hypothetical protein